MILSKYFLHLTKSSMQRYQSFSVSCCHQWRQQPNIPVLSPMLLPNGMQIELDLLPDVSTHPLFPDKSLHRQFYRCKLSHSPGNQPILPFSMQSSSAWTAKHTSLIFFRNFNLKSKNILGTAFIMIAVWWSPALSGNLERFLFQTPD